MDFNLRSLLRRVAEEVEAEIRQVEKELAEARRVGARAEELSAIRDILYEDKWFRIATAVFTQLKKEFAEDGKAAEVIEAAYISPPALRICQSTCTTFAA
jgi:metal-dependent amidase/aminoacylase/carboxypeptidase family protein